MSDAAIETAPILTPEQKRLALDAVLQSHTFARADQLKSFLRYVCEMEFAGHGQELTEYLIGVEALGRPSNYSPGDDSAVRNRAFALRKKLQEFYEHENQEAPVRIELLKGSYCPHFIDASQSEMSNGKTASPHTFSAPQMVPQASTMIPVLVDLPATTSALEGSTIPAEPSQRFEWKRSVPSFLFGILVATLIALALYLTGGAGMLSMNVMRNSPPILAEAWGPLLATSADVLICVANPPSFSVHPATSKLPVRSVPQFNDPNGRQVPEELIGWYKKQFPTPDEYDLFMTLTTNATYWGDSIGAMVTFKTMLSAGIMPKLFPEKVISMPTLRQRNVVLVGAPEYSLAIAHFLEKCPLTVSYLHSIISRENQFPPTQYETKRDEKNRLIQVYGLITVLPSESTTNHQHRTLIFSGVNSAGTQAAAEFFSSPENLLELQKHLKKEGHDTFPPAYQVAISAETDDNILLNFRYETHRVINTPNH